MDELKEETIDVITNNPDVTDLVTTSSSAAARNTVSNPDHGRQSESSPAPFDTKQSLKLKPSVFSQVEQSEAALSADSRAESDSAQLDRVRKLSVIGAVAGTLISIIFTNFHTSLDIAAPVYVGLACAQSYLAYRIFVIFKCRFKIQELSPAKAAISLFLPNIVPLISQGAMAGIMYLYYAMAPMTVLTPLGSDLAILVSALCLYSFACQWKWTNQIGRRFLAIESKSAGDPSIEVSKPTLFFSWVFVAVGLCFPATWYFLVPLIYASAGKSNLLIWDTLDSATRHRISTNATKKQAIVKDPNCMVLRYQTSTGVEQWVRERFSEKSWKKGAFMLTIAALFLLFGGPTLFASALPGLFAAGAAASGTTIGSASAAASAATASSLISAIVNCMVLPLFGFIIFHVWRTPTNLELTNNGVRFLWRYPGFKRVGPMVPWTAIEDVSIKRPFGKTLPQDASVCLSGSGGKELLNAKLRFIPSVDDKANFLEALEKWCRRSTARGADVIELLSPPADHSYTELWLQALSAPPKRERLKPLLPEAVLHDDSYQIICDIGAGGQGFAYLATDMKTHEKVVLKEYLLPIFVDMDSRRQAISHFEMEARTLQSLQSDQIVKLLDFFIEDHRAYLVLEHIDGESLKQLVERIGPLKTHNVLQLASQMCEILHYLHGLTPPLVHRDFTPDNLILRPDGKLKLIDFNVAQKLDNESTFTGTIVGKQSYLPPEQFRGTACPASDIYALGCCLFYLLVGHDPEPITVSHPRKERDSVPPELDQITAKATELEVEDRFTTIDDVATRIKSMLETGDYGEI